MFASMTPTVATTQLTGVTKMLESCKERSFNGKYLHANPLMYPKLGPFDGNKDQIFPYLKIQT
jgi:hypothetical protein